MEIVSLIVSIISMIGTLISAITAKSEVKKIKMVQEVIGNNNKQFMGDIRNG